MITSSELEIVVPLSKGKTTLVLLGSIAFVTASIWMWWIADSQSQHHPLYMKGVAVAGVAFFALTGLYACFKLFDRKPGLIVDSEGIVDNSNAASVGRIRWDEIAGMRVVQVAGERILTIEVTDPKKFLDRGGHFRRMLMSANVKLTGGTINLSSVGLKIDFDGLVRILTEAHERHKVNRKPISGIHLGGKS